MIVIVGCRRAVLRAGEEGVAMIVALMAVTLLAALGAALTVATVTDTAIVAHAREGREALHAAEAALERAIAEVVRVPDWNLLLTGETRSVFVDGPSGGTRTLADGSIISLDEATWMAQCGRPSPCSDAELDAVTADRPWGANNPRWRLFAHVPLRQLLAGAEVDGRAYVVVWVADDPADQDGDPLRDGPASGVGRGVIALRAQAHGLRRAVRTVEATLARRGGAARLLTWRQVR